MFRSLFQSKRTVRVPIDDAGHDVRRVKIIQRAMSKPSSFVTGFFVAYFIVRVLESTFSISDESSTGSKTDVTDKGKTGQGISTSQNRVTNHWKKAHQDLQEKENARNSKSNTTQARPSNASQGSNTKPLESQPDQLPQDMITALTVPVWIRERKCPLYTSSDPEYKEYVQLQSDKQRMAKLKQQVVDWAVSRFKNPIHAAGLSYVGYKGQIVCILELIPQLRPPPLYEVPCLIVFRDGIGWGWRVLPPQVGAKMDSLMRPSIAFAAAKASFSAFFATSYTIAKARFSSEQSKTVTTGKAVLPTPNPVMSEKEIARDNNIPPVSRWSSTPQSIQELIRAVHNGQSFQERHSSLIKSVPFSTAIQVAAETYKRKQVLGTGLHTQLKTRGVVNIRGTIYCMGDCGKYRLGVTACYLPSEDRFIGPVVLSSAYLIKDYSQWDKMEQAEKKKKAENPKGEATSATKVNEPASAKPQSDPEK